MKQARVATSAETTVDRSASQEPFGKHAPNAIQQFLITTARHSPLKRGKARNVMTRLIRSLGDRRLDVCFRDAHYRIGFENNLIECGLLLNPGYNSKDIEFLAEGLAEGGVFVDVGSNVGLYALPLAMRIGPSGTVVCVDANPLMAQRLSQNAELSQLSNIQMFCCGVSDSSGTASLEIRHDDLAIVNIVDDQQGTIPVRTLESVIAESGVKKVDCLKIDIEGHEDRALVPYLESVKDSLVPNRIVIEHLIEGGWSACRAVFDRLGYREIGRTRTNALYLRD